MKRALIGGGIAGLLAVAGMLWLLSNWSPPPEIPLDTDHRRGRGTTACVACHGPDGDAARSKNHPLNDRCFQCHLWTGQNGL